MQIGLLITMAVIVLVGGTLVCLGWWKLADRWFPGVSRKTGQEIRLRRRHDGADPAAGATVIKDFPRVTDETADPPSHAPERAS